MDRGEKLTGLQIILEAGFMQIDCNKLGNFYMIIDITVKFIMTLLNQTIFPILFFQSNLPVAMAAFTSPIAWVISISRGQHSVQLKTV